ncbi:MAG: amidase [Gammaproteobacteria bacterium]|nr:amidase [Gammaproteobacteria bacterium]
MNMRLLAIPFVISLAACEPEPRPDVNDIAAAEQLSGVSMTAEERELMLAGIREQRESFDALHEFDIPNEVSPALVFEPGFDIPEPVDEQLSEYLVPSDVTRPESDEDLAFMSVAELGVLLRKGELTSVELTEIYLDRIDALNPRLQAVITVTRDAALAHAREMDAELAAGKDRGPLHGIPYGLKDLFSVPGYPTTWGATPFKEQVIDQLATVPAKLHEAGAVLIAKTSVGALAWGDVWFDGTAKTPWNLEVGASGSSAGSGSGLAAGLFAFAIGTETWGSIVSPSIRNGVTGLRPTFGRVSRAGAMALSWSMDKAGPMCRVAEDCAMVLDAIRGTDPAGSDRKDPSAVDAPFVYLSESGLTGLRLGYLAEDFNLESGYTEQDNDRALLDALTAAGIQLKAKSLPDLPAGAMSFILSAEAAAAFDSLTRSGADDELVRQIENAWPNVFRTARFIPAVEYIQANRLRRQLVHEVSALFEDVDAILAPCFAGGQLLVTNLSGHPSMVLPHGLNEQGTPTGICIIGPAFSEATLVRVADALQADFVDFHERRPDDLAAAAGPASAPGAE